MFSLSLTTFLFGLVFRSAHCLLPPPLSFLVIVCHPNLNKGFIWTSLSWHGVSPLRPTPCVDGVQVHATAAECVCWLHMPARRTAVVSDTIKTNKGFMFQRYAWGRGR